MAVVRRTWIPFVLLVALAAGTAADRPKARQIVQVGDYQVLNGDFHLHSGLWSGGTLTPWGLVLEAERQGLDVIALTGHNETGDAHVARAFARLAGGPVVLVGEEITSAEQDLVAIGIERTVSPTLTLAEQIADVHQQGGLAIAPHPGDRYRAAYRGAMQLIDGAEVCHPGMWEGPEWGAQYERFKMDTPAAMPIGSSDFHFMGHPGSCRTFIFAREATTPAVMEALRAHRTVVFGPSGRAYGAPALVKLAEDAGLRHVAASYQQTSGSTLDWISRVAAIAGLCGIAFAVRPRASRPAAARP